METMDRDKLFALHVQQIEAKTPARRAYLQGRIDEYAAQNGLSAEDVGDVLRDALSYAPVGAR